VEPELQKKLMNDFPKLFNYRGKGSFVYFECWGGWYDLIRELCEKIYPLLKDDIEDDREMYAVQVKQKYGSLRFYMSHATDEIFDIIEEYEKKSTTICEDCGKPGYLNNKGWISTLCEEHHKSQNSSWKEG